MAWWAICFLAILCTIICKFYSTTACNRLRRTLARRQREALESKGKLSDARQEHQARLRACREKEVAIKRLQSQIGTLKEKVEQARADAEEAASERQPRRRL